MSARAVAASCSIVRSPSPSSSSDPGRSRCAPAARRGPSAACSASSALARRRIAASLLTISRSVRSSAMYGRWRILRQPAAMVARDVRDDRRLVVGEAEDLRRREDVLRMLVMRAQADVHADVVQQRRDLQQQPLALAEAVLVAQLVEQPRRPASRRDGRARGRSGSGGRAPRRWPAPGARSLRRSRRLFGSATSSSTPARSDASETTTLRAAVSDSSAGR